MVISNKFIILATLVLSSSVAHANDNRCIQLSDGIAGTYDIVDAIGCGDPANLSGARHERLCPDYLSNASQSLIDYKKNCNEANDKSYSKTIKLVNKLTQYSTLYKKKK